MTTETTIRDNRRRGWGWFHYEIIDEYGPLIGPGGIAVYMALARFADNGQTCWPAIPTIAKKTGSSERQVKRLLALLVDVGLIASTPQFDEEGRQRPNIYTLLTPPSMTALVDRGDCVAPTGVTGSPGGGDCVAYKQDLREQDLKEQESTPAQMATPFPPEPVPEVPPTPRSRKPRATGATAMPPTFTADAEMLAWARTNCPHVLAPAASTGRFVAHFCNSPKMHRTPEGWRHEWEKWMHGDEAHALERAAQQGRKAPTVPPPPGSGTSPALSSFMAASNQGRAALEARVARRQQQQAVGT